MKCGALRICPSLEIKGIPPGMIIPGAADRPAGGLFLCA